MKKDITISRDEFYTYEVIRSSGLTNMFDVQMVIAYSKVVGGPILTKDSIVEIMTNYDKYLKKYPLPESGVVKIKRLEQKGEQES
jgi:hypothetical protein